ncbi:ATP-binding cassette domain-containing protein, partial [Halomonas sp. MG34]|nr:ATP-binding cassette domain-containing protein [Halomonas sp. MG34]
MTEPIVTFQDVHKSFGDVEVLKGINLDIKPAEKVAVIGPSGSGKTTIIRMLMTLEKPTSGDIIVDGKNRWKMDKNG